MIDVASDFGLAQSIIDSIPANIAVLDPDGNIIAVNQSWINFARQNGVRDTSAIGVGRNYLEICRRAGGGRSNEFAEKAYEGIKEVISGVSKDFVLEYPCHAPHERRWFQMHVVRVEKNGDSFSSPYFFTNRPQPQSKFHVIITHFNVTTLRENQLELQKLAMVSQKTDNSVIITDKHGRIEWVNEGFARLTGWTLEETKGKKPGSFLQGDKTDFAITQYISQKLDCYESFSAELVNYRKDGTPYWTLLQIQPIFDETGQIQNYFSIQKDITARKNIEFALRESEERMRLALESTSMGWWDWDLVENEFKGSPYLATMVGMEFNQESISYHDWSLMKHPDDRARTEALLRGHFQGHTEFVEYSYRVKHKQGHWVWLENRAKVVDRDENGKPLRMVGITRDVTEQYAVLDKLRRSENLHRQMSKMALIGWWEIELDTNVLSCSDEVLSIYELDPEVKPNVATFVGLYLPEDRDFVRKAVENAVSRGIQFDFTLPFVSPKSNLGWVRVIGEPILENGAVKKIIGSVQNVTDIKQAELTLRERQERFQILADNAPVMIYQANVLGKCSYVNKSWINLTGKPLEEQLGTGWKDCLHPEDLQYIESELQSAFKEKRAFTVQYRLRRHDGVYRTIIDNGSPVFNEDGEFVCYLGSCIDITDRIELEEQLRQSQKMEAMGQLAGGVAHDFNNLLTVIMNYSESLSRKLQQTDPTLSHYAERIKTASERAASLTNQLLAFSRKQVLQPKPHDLNVVVKDTVKFVRRLIPENIKTKTILSEGLGLIYVDRTQFEQVLMNLAVNARDAMPKGGTLIFETGAASAAMIQSFANPLENQSYVCLKVTDTGIGMDSETIKRIYEPFFTTKEVGEGTGLGLATVHGIVEQSGGHITVESKPGRGTSFSVFLPCLTENVEAVEDSFPYYIEKGSETLLVVDDDNEVREVIVHHLRETGYRVLFAKDGAEALRLYSEMSHEIDLLITDVIMPNLNGVRLCEELRKQNPKLKVLYISGFTDTEINSLGLSGNEISFLPKPFTLNELHEIIREIIVN
jgi:two-component system, cell cycle sensor histidine kinase and response regulator CckA